MLNSKLKEDVQVESIPTSTKLSANAHKNWPERRQIINWCYLNKMWVSLS